MAVQSRLRAKLESALYLSSLSLEEGSLMTKILVIEDEAVLRGEVVKWLTYDGYEVMSAVDGGEGLKAANHELPDLIISDISMPGLDGIGVLLELRASPATAAIPFIFVTARTSNEDVRRGMALGADDYITKPFSRLELLQAIQARLVKKTAQENHFRQQVEQLQEALTQEHEKRLLKSRLVAMFSHDLGNQIGVVLSSINLLRNYGERLGEKRRLEKLNAIESAGHRLEQMRQDMLLLAEMDTGHLTSELAPLQVRQYLQDIVAEFEVATGEQHQLSFASNFDDTLMADARLLRQIATNLISNAIKYSPDGGEVRIALEYEEGQFSLSVQDHGIGISDPDQARIMDAFQRGSNVGGISGTGLGLAIVKEAVDIQQGTVEIHSQVGSGTQVVVT